MTPDRERQRARRRRLKAQGWRDVGLWLPGDLIEQLDALAAESDETRTATMRRILTSAVNRRGGHRVRSSDSVRG